MKTTLLILLAVLLVLVCVVELRRATPPPPVPVATLAQKAPRPARVRPPAPVVERWIDISGPLKGRQIVAMMIPTYPEWAEVRGISGNVSYKIWVHPMGEVSSFMQLVRTTSEPKLDDVAETALRQWRFGAIPNATGDQWGIVTFRFRLESVPPREIPISPTPRPMVRPIVAPSAIWP